MSLFSSRCQQLSAVWKYEHNLRFNGALGVICQESLPRQLPLFQQVYRSSQLQVSGVGGLMVHCKAKTNLSWNVGYYVHAFKTPITIPILEITVGPRTCQTRVRRWRDCIDRQVTFGESTEIYPSVKQICSSDMGY